MKVEIKLYKATPAKNGCFPLRWCFSEGKERVWVSTGLFAAEAEFDGDNLFLLGKIKNPLEKEKARRNNVYLTQELERAKMLLHELKMKEKEVTPKQFRDLFFAEKKKQGTTFFSFLEEFAGRKEGRTKEIYELTLNKLRKMYPRVLYFEDVDYRFLVDFEAACRRAGNRTNGIGIHLRNIRAVYNEAMKMKLVSRDLYPFNDFHVKKEETAHRALTLEQLRAVFAFEGTAAENYARDCAKLIFLLIGINATDLYDLQAPENDYISYRRDKTGKIYTIRVQPEMLPLFERFKGERSFLCFSEQFADCHALTKKINGTNGIRSGLCTIGEKLGVAGLTAYWLRHTWGTLAGELEIPKETIAQALGHGSKDTTDIYVKFNRNKIDEANRRVIEWVIKN